MALLLRALLCQRCLFKTFPERLLPLHGRLYFPLLFLFILFSSKIVTWSLSKRKIRKKWMTRQEMMKVTIIEATGWGLGPWSKPFLNHRSRNSENVKTIDGNLDGRKLIKGNWWKWNYLNWMKLDHVKLVKSENYEICLCVRWLVFGLLQQPDWRIAMVICRCRNTT